MLNDDEIVTSVQAESDPVDDETEEDKDNNYERSKGPLKAGTISALETAMERISGSSSDRGSFRVTRSTNGRGFPGEWASELSTCLWDGKCREGMRSVTGEELSPLVGQLVSHWEDGSLGRKGGVNEHNTE
ncbi:hypothetical protein TNCV_150731 [Trichonephila clavipes]|nr:hypothetical protein TNCV_150731 [Trichonephila clavipes]